MKHLMISAAFAATALTVPAVASAQARADILIVDSDRILSDCTACKAANAQLQQRQATLRTRAQTLQQQLATEGKPIQAAVDALGGKEPDAALQQRIGAYQTKERNAQQELATSQRTLESTLANVQQQVGSRLVTVVEQVRGRRGASVVMSKNSTIANDSAIDVTGEVLAALNQQLSSVSVTPLSQPAQPKQQPQGR
jgi:outer membrane protein